MDDEVEHKPAQKLEVRPINSETPQQAVARTMTRPSVQAGMSILNLQIGAGDVDLMSLIEELQHQQDVVRKGNVDRSEAMLVAQAATLDAIFHATLRRSSNNFGHYPETAERYMKLALKAQSQCRRTLTSISELRTPKAYIAQQNVAHGPQQVNNTMQNEENELLEKQHGERMDFGAPTQTVPDDSHLEAVAEVNGTKIR